MDGIDRWWRTWAPYWEQWEDRHFGRRVVDRLRADFRGPCLVLGAGRGLVVAHLRRRGVSAHGVDLCRAMLQAARTRGLELLQADAAVLPFRDAAFPTVVLNSGVADYVDRAEQAAPFFREARRVLAPGGRLLAGFFRLEAATEAIYRRLGVLDDRWYYPKRIFELDETAAVHPLRCVPLIVAWTGRSRLSTLFHWTRLGLFRPRSLEAERYAMYEVYALARRDGVDRQTLIRALPDRIRYRTDPELRELGETQGLAGAEWIRFPDCLVARVARPGEAAP